jgi:hypothetical protein
MAAGMMAALAAPLAARESLGVFGSWGVFRDPDVPRCYAIAMARPSTLQRDYQPYASIGTWPARQLRNQLHLRLSRRIGAGGQITLVISGQRFILTGGGGDAWALDRRMDAAVIAAMRSAGSMTVGAVDAQGRRFANSYDLEGAATAMDAAAVGCAKAKS